jgi:hypothetical protein
MAHKTPMSLRPAVSSTNSLLAIFSIWLECNMKDLLPQARSFLIIISLLIEELKHLHIPETARIFTADAKSMYTNIDTTTGLAAIRDFLNKSKEKIPTNFPKVLFLQVLKTIMRNNIFSFADNYWLQLSGTAMGTPAACAFAMLTCGQFENTMLLLTFQDNLIYYCHYIDDMFGIWLPPALNITSTWTNFKNTMSSCGNLKWLIEQPTNQTHFLDLNITIRNSNNK